MRKGVSLLQLFESYIAVATMKISVVILIIPVAMAMIDDEMDLLLVHGVWRHGDRSPTRTFPTDPIQEADWTFGGGGFGQLSPKGMAQHLKFGKLLRKLYVDTGFLSNSYSSREVYIRSTDVNRTIISAMSNMLGMYGQNDGSSHAGVDYPNETGWPVGYVPIPVHVVDFRTDHIGNPDAECKRMSLLWEMAKASPELQTFQKEPDVLELLHHLTGYCGQTIDIDNLWSIRDVLFIEQIHKNATLRAKNEWFTDDLFNKITDVNNQITLYRNGIYNRTLMMNNLDIGQEIQKVRGGSLFNDINSRMNAKLDCINSASPKCIWIKPLKYYVYSAHDTTVYAFLSVMGIEERVVWPSGFPAYSAGVFIELWMNRTDSQPYFKLLYHKNGLNDTLNPITHFIGACGCTTVYCKLDVFRNFAARTKPDESMETWCNVDPRKSSTSLWTLSSIVFLILSQMWLNE